jgi:uncharacterized protein YkwD
LTAKAVKHPRFVRGVAASICAVALVAAVTAPGAASRAASPAKRVLTSREAALVAEINAVRAAHLLPRLRIDTRLVRAARSHSRDMLRRQYFAHGDFGGRISRFGVRGRTFAENLVWGSGIMSADADVAEWLASPPHRANLLDPDLRRVGVATPIGSFSGFSPATVVTADFAG